MIEVFYDCSSPWTYLGFESLVKLAAEEDVAIVWRPILVGGVFNAVNGSVYAQRENPIAPKRAYMLKDIQDWARLQGLTIRFPPTVFPVNSANAMRACIVADEQGALVPLSRRLFQLYWSEDWDISQPEIIRLALSDVGLDADTVLARAGSPELRAQLKANTDEVIARGGFGSPTIFVAGDDMYFGNDRVPLVRAAIARARKMQ